MNFFGRKTTAAAVKKDVKSDLENGVKIGVAKTTVAPTAPVGDAPKADASADAAPEAVTEGDAPVVGADTGGAKAVAGGGDAPIGTPTSPAPVPHSSRFAFLDKGSDTMNAASPPKAPPGILPPGATRLDPSPRRTVDGPVGAPGALTGLMSGTRPEAAPVPVATPAPAETVETAQRRLTVGRDILLAGEIASCDVLVVEGTVEAKLRDGHSIEVAETGLFKGSVEIDDADIAGRFEGDLLVRRRLRVRASGRIIGSVVYGELEVEAGGQVVGSIKLFDPAEKPAEKPAETVSAETETDNGGGARAPMGFVPQSQPDGDQQPVYNQY